MGIKNKETPRNLGNYISTKVGFYSKGWNWEISSFHSDGGIEHKDQEIRFGVETFSPFSHTIAMDIERVCGVLLSLLTSSNKPELWLNCKERLENSGYGSGTYLSLPLIWMKEGATQSCPFSPSLRIPQEQIKHSDKYTPSHRTHAGPCLTGSTVDWGSQEQRAMFQDLLSPL